MLKIGVFRIGKLDCNRPSRWSRPELCFFMDAVKDMISRRVFVKRLMFVSLALLTIRFFVVYTVQHDHLRHSAKETRSRGLVYCDFFFHRIQAKRCLFADPESESCQPIRLQPWDYSIRHLMSPQQDPMADCEIKFSPKSFLDSDGRLWINRSGDVVSEEICFYRCVFPVSDFEIRTEEWVVIEEEGTTPKCDFVEVECRVRNKTHYKFGHLQIVEKR